MKPRDRSRVTQVMRRDSLASKGAGDTTDQIRLMVENGEEPKKIYGAIVECCMNTPGAIGAAIFVPSERAHDQLEVAGFAGEVEIEPNLDVSSESAGRLALQLTGKHYHRSIKGNTVYFDIICLGAPIGSIAVVAPDGLNEDSCHKLGELAYQTSIVFERQRLSGRL
ncbi:MAG: hypothetical protein KDD53_13065, partial [Bdellovibrionales bacterium]|nr:hypothetical protein [Bdellovibrionales bacterium]